MDCDRVAHPSALALRVLAVVFLVGHPVIADAGGPASDDPAMVAVAASLEIERVLLTEDRQAFEDLSQKQIVVATRLTRLHAALNAAVTHDEAVAIEVLDRLSGQLDRLEAERAEIQIASRVLIDRLRDRLRRVELFEEQLAELADRPQAARGILDGAWDVVLLPAGQRGSFELHLTGTIITGTYRLAGGFSGSLRGTLVQTKVYLERIDSRLGRSMEFQGRLSGDLSRIRGTWLSLELTDGGNGQWSAQRQSVSDTESE